MEDSFDKNLRAFFADRISPSAEVRDALTQRLVEAQADHGRRQMFSLCFLILLFATLLSAASVLIVWLLLGSGVIVLAVSIYLSASIAGGLALVFALNSLSTKGGLAHAAHMD